MQISSFLVLANFQFSLLTMYPASSRLALQQLHGGPLRITDVPEAENPLLGFPLSASKQQFETCSASVQLCRAVLAAISRLHESLAHINGKLCRDTVHIVVHEPGNIQVQFEVPYTFGWDCFENELEAGRREDILAAGVLIRGILNRANVHRCSRRDYGEFSWMMQLSSWMTEDDPALRPTARCCQLHHANWDRFRRVAFVQAFFEYARRMKNTGGLGDLLPFGGVARLFPRPPGTYDNPSWKSSLRHDFPRVYELLGGSNGLQQWARLHGHNLSHFYQAARDWEAHWDGLDPELWATLDSDGPGQGPIDFLLGAYPDLLEYAIQRIVFCGAHLEHPRLRDLLEHYSAACSSYLKSSTGSRFAA